MAVSTCMSLHRALASIWLCSIPAVRDTILVMMIVTLCSQAKDFVIMTFTCVFFPSVSYIVNQINIVMKVSVTTKHASFMKLWMTVDRVFTMMHVMMKRKKAEVVEEIVMFVASRGVLMPGGVAVTHNTLCLTAQLSVHLTCLAQEVPCAAMTSKVAAATQATATQNDVPTAPPRPQTPPLTTLRMALL